MTILVTGANGQLGTEMRLVAKTDGNDGLTQAPGDGNMTAGNDGLTQAPSEGNMTDGNDGLTQAPGDGNMTAGTDRWIFSDICQIEGVETTILDISDKAAVDAFVDAEEVDVIVNCAAYTNVDAAESNTELAEKLNADAAGILAEAMARRNGLIVQISTDYVFGKEPYNTPCREDQSGTPTGVYGLTKLHGEQKIMASGCKHIIIRTAWLYSEFGKNFCKTMLNLTATKPQLNVVFDQTGTPTYALDLARAIMTILEDYRDCASDSVYPKTGIYHYSNEGVCSWYDFTKMIAEYSGQTNCRILPCHSDEFPSPVTRPAYSVLDKTRIKTVFGVDVPYWTDSLKVCLANMGKLK